MRRTLERNNRMLGYDSDIVSLIYSLNVDQRCRLSALLSEFAKETPDIFGSDSDFPMDEIHEKILSVTEYEKGIEEKKQAAARGETTIPQDSWGVHRTHCCSKHGCKYGHADCPVVVGILKQDHPCEYCDDDNRFKGIFD